MILMIYALTLLAFTLYSYSQIDLNLTLSSNQAYQYLQNGLIQLGYFNRPLSALIYFLLLFLLSTFYFLFSYQVVHKKLNQKNIVRLIIVSLVVFLFSYPAFSHDIFNYMFDARIVTKYHLNPYFYTALDFQGDLWTRFMHWTHRTYPYGPLWLFITLPLSYLGLGKFVPTLFLFKLFFGLFHLGNIYLIYKILRKTIPKHTLRGVVFYAFNPVIMIESLISPHNEVVMLFFLLTGLYFLAVKGKRIHAVISILFSGAIKFITAVLLPLFLVPFKNNRFIFKLSLLILLVPVVIQTTFRQPYPWYFITFIGVGSLLVENSSLTTVLSGLSIGLLLRYAPYLYFGDYAEITGLWQTRLFLAPFAVSILIACYNALKTHSWKPF